MNGALGPVMPYFMIVSLLLTSAIPTMETIRGSICRQYARAALAIVGVSDPWAYRFHEHAGPILRELLPSHRQPTSLVAFDENQQIPTAQEWHRLQNHLGKLERLGNRIAEQLEGRG